MKKQWNNPKLNNLNGKETESCGSLFAVDAIVQCKTCNACYNESQGSFLGSGNNITGTKCGDLGGTYNGSECTSTSYKQACIGDNDIVS